MWDVVQSVWDIANFATENTENTGDRELIPSDKWELLTSLHLFVSKHGYASDTRLWPSAEANPPTHLTRIGGAPIYFSYSAN